MYVPVSTSYIIGFADADDVCDKRLFEKMYYSLLKNKAQIAICSLLFEMEHQTVYQGDKTRSYICMDKETAIIELYRGSIYSGHVHNKIFRRELCESVSFDEDISIGEDTLFCLKTLSKASEIVYINDALYHYQIRSNSAYQQKNIDKMYTSHISYGRMNKILDNLALDRTTRNIFYISYMSNIKNLLMIFKEQKRTKDERYAKLKRKLKTLYLDTFEELTKLQKIRFGIGVYFLDILFVKYKLGIILRKVRK